MAAHVVALLLTLTVGWLLWKVLRFLWPLLRCLSIPALPGDRLIGGHLYLFAPGVMTIKDKYERFAVARKHSRLVRCNIAFRLPMSIFLLHPDTVSAVFNNNIEIKGEFFPYRSLTPMLGNSLLLAGGARWKRNRNLLKLAFGRQEIRSFFPTFRGLAEELVQHWSRKIEKEGLSEDGSGQRSVSFVIDDHLAKFTLEAILRCAFCLSSADWIEAEHEYGALIDKFFYLHMNRYTAGTALHLSDLYYFNCTTAGREYRSVCRRALDIARDVLARRREARTSKTENNDSDGKCVVDILLNARDPTTGEGFSEEELVYECNLFLVAGYETTSRGLAWLMYLLGSHPEELRRCQEEIDNVLGEEEELTWMSLNEMTYVIQCIKETLRLYPPASGEVRILPKDVVLDGYTVPAGIKVAPATVVLHRDPDFWERPHDFYPEHFSAEQEAKRRPDVFRPFSSGPRKCLGETFAMDEMKVLAVSLLRRFDFEADPTHPVRDALHAILVPENGIKLILRHRSI